MKFESCLQRTGFKCGSVQSLFAAAFLVSAITSVAMSCKNLEKSDSEAKGRHGSDGVQVGLEWVKKVKTKFTEIATQSDGLTQTTAGVAFSDPNSDAGRNAQKGVQDQIASISEDIVKILDQFELILDDGVVINADSGVITVPENDGTSRGRPIAGIRTVMTMVQSLKTDVKSKLIPSTIDLAQINPQTKLQAFNNVQSIIRGIGTTVANIQAALATWPTQAGPRQGNGPNSGDRAGLTRIVLDGFFLASYNGVPSEEASWINATNAWHSGLSGYYNEAYVGGDIDRQIGTREHYSAGNMHGFTGPATAAFDLNLPQGSFVRGPQEGTTIRGDSLSWQGPITAVDNWSKNCATEINNRRVALGSRFVAGDCGTAPRVNSASGNFVIESKVRFWALEGEMGALATVATPPVTCDASHQFKGKCWYQGDAFEDCPSVCKKNSQKAVDRATCDITYNDCKDMITQWNLFNPRYAKQVSGDRSEWGCHFRYNDKSTASWGGDQCQMYAKPLSDMGFTTGRPETPIFRMCACH